MSIYRDDVQAAQERIRALEEELAKARSECEAAEARSDERVRKIYQELEVLRASKGAADPNQTSSALPLLIGIVGAAVIVCATIVGGALLMNSKSPAPPPIVVPVTPDTVQREPYIPIVPAPPAPTEPEPVSDAGPAFDRGAALATLTEASKASAACKKPGGPSGAGRVSVTFAPSGRVTSASVEGPPFAGTAVGACIAQTFRKASIPAFSGAPVTVHKSVVVE